MHHALRFYSRHREIFLRYYILQAKWTRIPLLGRVVGKVASFYASTSHNAYLLTREEAEQVVEASAKLWVGPCSCRKVFHHCDNPVNVEILIGKEPHVFAEERPGEYRQVSRQEAKEILELCHERHLVPTIVRCGRDFYAICHCCPCCCVPLRLKNQYHIGRAAVRDEAAVQLLGCQKELLQSIPAPAIAPGCGRLPCRGAEPQSFELTLRSML